MKKKQATSQGELTDNPDDKDPFRRKQQKTVSDESSRHRPHVKPWRDRSTYTPEQLKAWLNFGEATYGRHGIRGKEWYRSKDGKIHVVPRSVAEVGKKLNGRKHKRSET